MTELVILYSLLSTCSFRWFRDKIVTYCNTLRNESVVQKSPGWLDMLAETSLKEMIYSDMNYCLRRMIKWTSAVWSEKKLVILKFFEWPWRGKSKKKKATNKMMWQSERPLLFELYTKVYCVVSQGFKELITLSTSK